MRATPSLFALALLAAALGGCTDAPESEPEDDTAPDTGRDDVEFQAELPDWRLGQGWQYIVDRPGTKTETMTMMVAETHDDLWVVASDDRTKALDHALFSKTPVLGRVGKETLSPFQDGEAVNMYEFPLVDGKRWSAPFFREDMEFHAVHVGDIELQERLGLGAFTQGFQITATGPSGTSVQYDYVEAADWFTSFEVLDPEGERVVRLDLVDILDDYQGPYHFLRGEDLLIDTHHSDMDAPLAETITIPAPQKFHDGLVLGITYLGQSSLLPAHANITFTGPPDDELPSTPYFQAEFTGLGQEFTRADLPIESSCLDPDDGSCTGELEIEVRLTGEVDVEIRVVAYQRFAEGDL